MTHADPTPSSPPRVLVVEDDGALLELGRRVLVRAGWDVTTAPSAEEALARAEGQTFDLLFADVVLPGATGLVLADRLRTRHPDLPVLLTTGQSEREVLRTLTASGYPLLRKPYTAPDLLDAIAAARLPGADAPDRTP